MLESTGRVRASVNIQHSDQITQAGVRGQWSPLADANAYATERSKICASPTMAFVVLNVGRGCATVLHSSAVLEPCCVGECNGGGSACLRVVTA